MWNFDWLKKDITPKQKTNFEIQQKKPSLTGHIALIVLPAVLSYASFAMDIDGEFNLGMIDVVVSVTNKLLISILISFLLFLIVHFVIAFSKKHISKIPINNYFKNKRTDIYITFFFLFLTAFIQSSSSANHNNNTQITFTIQLEDTYNESVKKEGITIYMKSINDTPIQEKQTNSQGKAVFELSKDYENKTVKLELMPNRKDNYEPRRENEMVEDGGEKSITITFKN